MKLEVHARVGILLKAACMYALVVSDRCSTVKYSNKIIGRGNIPITYVLIKGDGIPKELAQVGSL